MLANLLKVILWWNVAVFICRKKGDRHGLTTSTTKHSIDMWLNLISVHCFDINYDTYKIRNHEILRSQLYLYLMQLARNCFYQFTMNAQSYSKWLAKFNPICWLNNNLDSCSPSSSSHHTFVDRVYWFFSHSCRFVTEINRALKDIII